MGQVTRLHVPPSAYPDACTKLDTAACVLLLAIRWWVSAYWEKEDTLFRLCLGLEKAGAYEAAFLIDTLMGVVARTANRTLTVQCPRCPSVSEDEKHLLHAAALAQHGDSARAEAVLRKTLLSAHGASVALIPLEEIGASFAGARLMLQMPLGGGAAKRAGRPSDQTIH